MSDKKINQAAVDALTERGLDVNLAPLLHQFLVEADDGTVKSKSGRTPIELVDAMPKHKELGKYFAGGNAPASKPSWEGKKYSEMTIDEKIEYCDAQAEKGAYR